MMTKVKTSTYIDREAWERFKRYASRGGVEASRLLKEIIMDEGLAEALNEAVSGISPSGGYELHDIAIKEKLK
jgi:DNA-directed RNA polymerase subunit F